MHRAPGEHEGAGKQQCRKNGPDDLLDPAGLTSDRKRRVVGGAAGEGRERGRWPEDGEEYEKLRNGAGGRSNPEDCVENDWAHVVEK
jgi:hypothetical protein